MNYDIVIPLLDVDLYSFLCSYPYIIQNLPCKKIVLIGNKDVCGKIRGLDKVDFIDENLLLEGLSLDKVKELKKELSGNTKRAGWYFQQFLKIGYARICKDEYYLIWDGDTIPVNKIDFFTSDGHPYLSYRDYVKNDKCFDYCQNNLLPHQALKKKVHRSYIAEHMLINVSVMNEFLDFLESNTEVKGNVFYEKIMHCVPLRYINLSGFSEFEAYAAYLLKYHPSLYVERRWKNLRNAKTYIGSNPRDRDIAWVKNEFDVISIEDFNSFWAICRFIRWIDSNRKIPFRWVYWFINPVASVLGKVRFIVRDIVKR